MSGPDPPGVLANLLDRADSGDPAAREALFTALYAELHRLAESHLRRSAVPLTLGTTTLLHEAYLALSGRAGPRFPDRNRFLGYASRAMRGLVINYTRDRRARKRGGGITFVDLDESRDAVGGIDDDLEALGTALEQLEALQPDLAEVVDLRFFCGFTFAEIAAIRGISERTVQRDWAKARLLLHRWLSRDSGGV